MPKAIKRSISETNIALAGKKYCSLILNKPGSKPSIYKIFKELSFSQRSIKQWIEDVGGVSKAHDILAIDQDEIVKLYKETVDCIMSRVKDNKIGDKELLELFRIVTGIQESNNTSVTVNVGTKIDDFLKNNDIIDV